MNIKYDRGGNAGEGYLTVQQIAEVLAETPGYPSYYSQEELDGLMSASDAVQNRMRIKVSKQYMDHCMKVPENAKHPHPVLPIVLPDLTELDEVEGEADPSNQNRYSPMSGLLHKYEMVSFVIRPCATPSTDSTKSYPLRRRLGGAPSLAGEIFQQWTNQRRSL